MCLFRKPKINDRVSIDIIIPGGEKTIRMMNIPRYRLQEFLTRKQIKYLNSLVPPEMETIKFDERTAREMEIQYRAEERRKEEFAEANHIKTDEDYNQYFINNKDKAVLSTEEEVKLKEMFENIEKKRQETMEKLKATELKKNTSSRRRKASEEYADAFFNSATNGNK